MKKLTLFLATLIVFKSNAQFLTDGADGKGTIPLPLNGLGISVDAGKTSVNFGINNYDDAIQKNKPWFFGANLNAKNASGLASLFSAGEIVPQGELTLFAGYSWFNFRQLEKQYQKSTYFKNLQELERRQRLLTDTFRIAIKASLLDAAKAEIPNEKIRDSVLHTLNKQADTLQAIRLVRFFNNFTVKDTAFKKFTEHFKANYKNDTSEYNTGKREAREAYVETQPSVNYAAYLRRRTPVRLSIFPMGGITARSFTRFLGASTPALAKSFQDTLFRGGNFGLGINFQVRNYWLGVTYSYNDGDNFGQMRSKDYTLRTTDTSGNQALVSEKKVTAYGGKYSKVENNILNIDLLGEFNLGDTSRLLVNFYCRAAVHSRDTAYIQNITNLGAGFYFLGKKGKFIGGLYVELPDINNNVEKAKPLSEQNIRSPFRRLSFGIVTKFNISSIFGFSPSSPTSTE